MTMLAFQDESTAIKDLVERAQAGDSAAIGELFERYHDTLMRFVYYRIGNNRAVVEDIVGDVWVRALKSLHAFTWSGTDIGAWLITIARNLIADYRKSAAVRLTSAVGDPAYIDWWVDSAQERSAEESACDTLTYLCLGQLVARLGPDQRQCIELRFLAQMSVAETAAVMDRTDGAVKALQLRAMTSLARLMGPAGIDDRGAPPSRMVVQS